jgi:hypothetical protein
MVQECFVLCDSLTESFIYNLKAIEMLIECLMMSSKSFLEPPDRQGIKGVWCADLLRLAPV